VSHAKADGTRPSAIVHDMNAGDHEPACVDAPAWRVRSSHGRDRATPIAAGGHRQAPGPVAGNHACPGGRLRIYT